MAGLAKGLETHLGWFANTNSLSLLLVFVGIYATKTQRSRVLQIALEPQWQEVAASL